MTPERWQQVQALLGAALERPVGERSSYVAGACAADDDLRREVDSLLRQASAGSGFLSTPAFDIDLDRAPQPSLVGRVIGSFTIRQQLASGGMGDVYLADDAGLRRTVAVKALREYGPPTPEGRERLLREARAAAALNHPNIATIFHVLDKIDAATPPLMVMEYVEGETLAERLRRGPLPLEEALRLTREVADALAVAHSRGIVHRDLKPANLRVNQQGRIKVLDFGLARQLAPAIDTGTMTVERTVHSIAPHRIAGTPGYASPEQTLGLTIAPPTDIFSLGVVLFEMLTGHRPFPGDDLGATGMAIMAMPTPKPSDFVRGIPPFVETLVGRMLAKEPAARPTAQEVVDVLGAVAPTGAATVDASRAPARRIASTAAVAIVVSLASAGGAAWWRSTRPPSPADRPAIAVLPLDNLSGDRSKDYLGVGIAETLTTSLAKLPTISVISRTTLSDRTRGADVRTIARDVGATMVLQGSVQQSGDRLRVSAKLLRPDGSVVWAGDADAGMSELFALETRLAASVIAALPIDVRRAEQQGALTPPTNNRDALQIYWQGLAFLDRGDLRNLALAISSFERATMLDSQFAAAFAALGDAYQQLYARSGETSLIPKATAAIERGLAIDPGRTEVRMSLGAVYTFTGRPADAIDEFRKIIADHPDNDEAHRRLAVVLDSIGKPEEALREYQLATTLRPEYWRNQQALGFFFYTQKRLHEAVAAFTRVIAIRQNSNAYLQRGSALQALGDRAAARADYEKAIALDADNAAAYSNLGFVYYENKQYGDAAAAFAAAIKLRPKRAAYHRNLGDAYLKLNKKDQATTEFLAAISLTNDAIGVNATDANALSQLALYEAKIGRASDARRHSDDAVKRNGASPEVLFRRGVALALIGDTQGAVSALRNAVNHGYNVDQIRTEDDLTGIASDAEFRKLILSGK